MDDELAHVLSMHLQLAAMWAALFSARLLPIVVFTPVFGGEIVPRRFRFGLTILLALPFALSAETAPLEALDAAHFALLMGKEALVGMVFAALVTALVETFAAAGALIDLGRGASIATLLDPLTRQQAQPLAGFLRQLVVVVFLTAGGYALLAQALTASLRVLPVHEVVPAAVIGPEALQGMLALIADLCLVAARLALPVFVAVLALDIAAGLVGRVAPQMELLQLSLAARASIGLFVLLLTLDAIVETFGVRLDDTLGAIAGAGR